MEVYHVKKLQLGDKLQGDCIIFSSLKDMEQAYKDIDNGKDIYVRTEDGLVTKLLHQMVNTKIYEGSMRISANIAENEETNIVKK